MIEIKHLTKKYGNNVAVEDLNLTLEPGHVYGFLGPNGAGKSTTMNIITGYIGASDGEVKINGYDINQEPEKAKSCIGYLPELPPVYGDMKVGEYLNFVAELKKLNKNTRVADIRQVMDLTKLHAMEKRLIRNLSKGYKQRVGLAQALLGMPEIIILDEPTVGLDPKQIIEIRELIASLREQHTVILSSHILQEISAVCDHVFIISNGRLVASDTMENLEEQMQGAQQLLLTVRGTAEEAASLGSLAEVKSCQIVETRMKAAEAKPEATGEKTIEELIAKSEAIEAKITEEPKVELQETGAEVVEALATEAAAPDQMAEASAEAAEIVLPEIRLELAAKPGKDIREAVFYHCAKNNLVILEMTSVTKSLEDVFLELTETKEVE